jgi:hypothetical protein
MDDLPVSHLLQLPSEIRVKIYNFLVRFGCIFIGPRHQTGNQKAKEGSQSQLSVRHSHSRRLKLQLTCRKIYLETAPMFASATNVLRMTTCDPLAKSIRPVPKFYLDNIRYLASWMFPSDIDLKHHLPALETVEILRRNAFFQLRRADDETSIQIQRQPRDFEGIISILKSSLQIQDFGKDFHVIQAIHYMLFRLDGPFRGDAKLESINVSTLDGDKYFITTC